MDFPSIIDHDCPRPWWHDESCKDPQIAITLNLWNGSPASVISPRDKMAPFVGSYHTGYNLKIISFFRFYLSVFWRTCVFARLTTDTLFVCLYLPNIFELLIESNQTGWDIDQMSRELSRFQSIGNGFSELEVKGLCRNPQNSLRPPDWNILVETRSNA